MKTQPVFIAGMFVGVAIMCVAQMCAQAAHASEREDTALLLAQSCIGEAGFDAEARRECAAIWHVLEWRRIYMGETLLKATLKYNASLKNINSSRSWVRHLRRDGKKPAGWSGANWAKKRDRWLSTLELADRFVDGDVPNPLPSARHFGGPMDPNPDPGQWRKLDAPFANWFYARR